MATGIRLATDKSLVSYVLAAGDNDCQAEVSAFRAVGE